MKVLALFCILLSCIHAGAAPQSHELPYYGEHFYADLAGGVVDAKLKADLKVILESSHQKVADGLDQIVQSCVDKNCYKHISLGYDTARIYMMGVFNLIQHQDGSYAIHDVYCDTDKEAADFINGNPPAPEVIPDGNILNTEHTWPQSRFGGGFNKGIQKSDMHHLFPADNKMNSIRGNNPFGEVVASAKPLKCTASRFGQSVDGRGEVFEPPVNHRGNVARALFYFSTRYNQAIEPKQEIVLRKWNKEDPVDEAELHRNDLIQSVQGNRNPFVDYPELVDSIHDF